VYDRVTVPFPRTYIKSRLRHETLGFPRKLQDAVGKEDNVK